MATSQAETSLTKTLLPRSSTRSRARAGIAEEPSKNQIAICVSTSMSMLQAKLFRDFGVKRVELLVIQQKGLVCGNAKRTLL